MSDRDNIGRTPEWRELSNLPLEAEKHAHCKDNEYLLAENARLRAAVELLRACELAGEQGADHPIVLKALEGGHP